MTEAFRRLLFFKFISHKNVLTSIFIHPSKIMDKTDVPFITHQGKKSLHHIFLNDNFPLFEEKSLFVYAISDLIILFSTFLKPLEPHKKYQISFNFHSFTYTRTLWDHGDVFVITLTPFESLT